MSRIIIKRLVPAKLGLVRGLLAVGSDHTLDVHANFVLRNSMRHSPALDARWAD